MPLPHVVTVAVQELEAWLIADPSAASSALGHLCPEPPSPESLRRTEAKSLLDGWLAAAGASDDRLRVRAQIATSCDLDAVARACPSFDDFRKEICRLVALSGGG